MSATKEQTYEQLKSEFINIENELDKLYTQHRNANRGLCAYPSRKELCDTEVKWYGLGKRLANMSKDFVREHGHFESSYSQALLK